MFKSIATVAVLLVSVQVLAQDPPEADKLARGVIEEFGKAFKAGDSDAVMKFVAVPFNLDGRKVEKDEATVRAMFEKACSKQKNRPIDRLEIQFVKTLAALENEKKAPNRGVSFADVLDRKKDRMVLAHAITGERKEGILFGVRIEKGAAKIVGIYD